MLGWWQRLRNSTASFAPAHIVKGERGEAAAARYLRRRGYKILTRRFHGRHGEIDLIARDGTVLAFVEVKTRGSDRFGAAADAVNRDKRRHLASCAREYLRLLGNPRIPVRFDVVEVYMDEAGTAAEVRLIQGAFATREPFSD
jgi:putative endonuclease